jgi:hypothetical protein
MIFYNDYLAISVFVAILMTCIWTLGGRFKISGTIAFVVSAYGAFFLFYKLQCVTFNLEHTYKPNGMSYVLIFFVPFRTI